MGSVSSCQLRLKLQPGHTQIPESTAHAKMAITQFAQAHVAHLAHLAHVAHVAQVAHDSFSFMIHSLPNPKNPRTRTVWTVSRTVSRTGMMRRLDRKSVDAPRPCQGQTCSHLIHLLSRQSCQSCQSPHVIWPALWFVWIPDYRECLTGLPVHPASANQTQESSWPNMC